uniref:Ligand-gated ion channel 50 n=1 Tax=Ascaris suum TaxID=6253 RepID=F1L494_ASCSU
MWTDRCCLSIFAAILVQYRLVDSQSIHFEHSPPNEHKYSSAKYNRNNCTSDASVLAKLIDGSAYNKHRIPGAKGGVPINVEFWIQDISSISERTNDFVMDLYVNEIWHDSKLAFGHLSPCKGNLTLNEAVLSRLWTPNSCFVNSKVADIHDSPSRNIFLTLFSNGTLWINYRVRVKGPCSMDLSNFPMDTQTCLLIYESFNYNNQEVRMRWNTDRPDPVYMLRPINLPDFDIQKIDPILVRVVYPAGLWDELQVRFTFKRRCVWYFLQSYVPTYLTIFISWIAFSLGPSPKAVQARTMLGVNALLAIIMQFGSTLRKLPRVSYVKAIDVWLLGSMTFIFLSLVELAIVGLKMRGEVKPPSPSTDCCCSKTSDPLRTVHRIDSCAKIIFPAVYSVFNIVYWAYYGLLVQ